MRNRVVAAVGVALIVLSWGLNYVVTKVGVSHVTPVDFVFWRFIGTAVVLTPWMARSLPRTRRDIVGLILMGVVGVAGYQWLFSTALHRTLSANVAFLFNLSPLLTLIWQRLAGRRVGSHMWWGGLLSLAGVAVLAGASWGGGLIGDLFALGAAATWSAFAIITDHVRVSVRGLAQTGWISLIGAVAVIPFMTYAPVWTMGPDTYLPLLYAIFFVTVVGLSLWQSTVERMGASRASLMLYLIPLVAAAAGWVFLHERLHLIQAAAALAILTGVAWADGRFSRHASKPPAGKDPAHPESLTAAGPTPG